MEIIIEINDEAQSSLNRQNIVFKNHSKKNKKNYAISLLVSIVLLILGFYDLKRQVNFPIINVVLIASGIGFLYSIWIIYRQNQKIKTLSTNYLDLMREKYKAKSNKAKIKINDTSVFLENDFLQQRY